ncbi:hypothetical protein M8J77_017131 [Diaphorina citri]|nr:hypothetical protein M8J77_017131 [Diaphorina citri]
MEAKQAKLTILTSKKEHTFSRLQEIYDLIKKMSTDKDKATAVQFKQKAYSVDSLKSEFYSLIERINLLEAELNVNRPTGFSSLTTVEDMYGSIKYTLQLLEKPAAPPTISNPTPHTSTSTEQDPFIKLVPLEIPSFSGELAEWPMFSNLFKVNIHDRTNLPKAHKLQYLLAKLTGRAQLMCSGIPPTEENYDIIWNSLIKRFDDKRNLATHYLDILQKFKPQKSESGENLNLFIDKVGAAVSALKALELPNLADFILFHLGISKIDDPTRRLFENTLTPEEIPTFQKLIDFAQDQTKVLFRIGNVSSKYKPSSDYKSHSYHKSGNASKLSHSFFVKNNYNNCSLCASDHPLFRCNKFLKLNPHERYSFARQHTLCVNCLGNNHRFPDCSSKNVCSVCKLKHHSLLHFNQNNPSGFDNQSKSSTSRPNSNNQLAQSIPSNSKHSSNSTNCKVNVNPVQKFNAVQLAEPSENLEPAEVSLCSQTENKNSNSAGTTVLLGTIKIKVFDINGYPHIMRFLLDSGSMSNIIIQSAVKTLNLPSSPSTSSLRGLGSASSTVLGQVNFSFTSRFDERIKFTTHALVVPNVVDKLPIHIIDCSKINHIKPLPLADDEFMEPGPIFGILGSSVYPYILLGDTVHGSVDQPVAVSTKLGHVIFGNAPMLSTSVDNQSHCMFQSSLDTDLVRFWEIENVPSVEGFKLSPEDKLCEEIYSSEVSRNDDGLYQVPLPFKEDPTQLGDSFTMAKKRFFLLEKRLQSSEDLRSSYDQAMSDLIDKGFMSKCSDQSDISGYFIPHHIVTKSESVSTKVRVVYDASCKTTSGKSLNDILHCGAKLYSNLFCVLLNFRLLPYALNGDITKMFMQIKLHEKYWKFQKIIWRFSPNEPLTFYNLSVVSFGLKSSPFLALRTVHQLISDESENYPLVSKNIPGMLYMDDLVASFLTENECVLFYREITELFKSGGFTFTKWSSNSAQVLHNIPASDQLEKMISWDKDNFTLKVLGMCWSPKEDKFHFKINQNIASNTKRGMLSYILTIYDPLGLLSPVILFVKLLIKRLWIAKIDWDSQPPPDILSLWNLFIQQLPSLENISFLRHINVKINCIFQLVGFADASEKAYGAVIYSRVILPDSTVKVELICAKSKVAPVKVESIPRLELCGLLLLSELMATVTKSYLSKFEIDESYCLTDSSVTLCWAHSSPHLYQVFIANRISKIQQNINISTLFHVSGQDNPADCLSRGLVPEQLVDCNLYLSGPPWLHQSPVEWPIRKYSDFAGQETPERKSNLSLIGVQDEPNPLLEMFLRCSSWYKILKIVILILRFLKIIPKGLAVSAEALNTAEIFVMKLLQKEFFPHDISNIRKGLPCSPQIRKLSPFLDDHGLLRVGGRISNSNVDYDQQHPILLSSKHHVVVLIVDYFHQKNYHTGPHLLLALLRQRFWILGARSLARKRFQACNICFRLSPKCSYPKMGDLPKSRVLESKPFLNTACDYLGPIHIVLTHRRGQRSQKAYICLFICLATKAVHLEVASDLTTECFLNAFKRFLSRRGPIRSMLSDGGSNFVGAKNKLNVIYDLLESPDYKDSFVRELSEHRITWTMNPPASPHFGGIFESNIKSFKTHFFRVVGKQLLSYEELVTLTTQIECLLNSRPLCKLSSDPDDMDILTPNHFLKLTNLTCIPAENVTELRVGRLSRFQLIDQLVQSFWKRWSTEYLSQLQTREKWHTSCNNIIPGVVVLIRQDGVAPLNWPTGVVSQVYPGRDGIVRVVSVKTPKGIYKRAVHNLCPLPTQ